MATEIFLQLDGIEGESQKDGAVGWIEIFSFSNGASNPSSVSFGTGSGAGKVDLSSISVQKQLDQATPKLFLFCCQGTHIAKGQLMVREATGDETPQAFFTYNLQEAFIDSISWGGASGGGKPSESVSVSFKQIQLEYFAQDTTGKVASKGKAGWNVTTNKKA